MRTLAAVAMFLFGTTFMWMTASFAGKTPPPTGAAWTLVNIVAVAALAGYTIAAWGLYRDHSWWQLVALVSAVAGLLAVVPFLVGLRQLDAGLADMGVQINLWMHVLGSLAVVAVVQVQPVNEWFTAHLS